MPVAVMLAVLKLRGCYYDTLPTGAHRLRLASSPLQAAVYYASVWSLHSGIFEPLHPTAGGVSGLLRGS